MGKINVLFFAEAATLAHAARSFVLASGLDPNTYDITFAWNRRFSSLFPPMPFKERLINSVSHEQFMHRLQQGNPLFNYRELKDHVLEDLKVIEEVNPTVVVGDFRLSLAVSARLAKVVYINLTNAYWSPFATPRYVVPELPIVSLFGSRFSQVVFNWIRKPAFKYHARHMNRLRSEYEIDPQNLDLLDVYTESDWTLYCDIPELIPTHNLPNNHRYLGPLLWSPSFALPPWWKVAAAQAPLVYVTLGSSGDNKAVPLIVEAVRRLPITVLLATAGKNSCHSWPDNIFHHPFLPGMEASALSQLVICNGGSPTTQQALSQGVPVIGIASNMDQYLNMYYLEKAGVGVTLRAGEFTAEGLRQCIQDCLQNKDMQSRAKEIKECIDKVHPLSSFDDLVRNEIYK